MDKKHSGAAPMYVIEALRDDLDVSPVQTSKDEIAQPELAAHENMYIPPLGSSVIICGKSGSGKSTLLANLLKDPRFYGKSKEKPRGWFDRVFIFSPTANGDDVQRSLNIPSKNIFTDLDEAPELLDIILDSQQKKLDEAVSAAHVPQYCIIFDDIIGDRAFMNSKAFKRCFYQVRHVNCTSFVCTQHWKYIPRMCRLQANFLFFFQGSQSEVDTFVEEFAPPMYKKQDFKQLVTEVCSAPYTFITVNMKLGWAKRFRCKLGGFIKLSLLNDK